MRWLPVSPCCRFHQGQLIVDLIPLPENGLEFIAYIGELLNINVLSEVLDALPKEEVNKATEWFNETLQKMPEALPQIVDMALKSEMIKNGNIE